MKYVTAVKYCRLINMSLLAILKESKNEEIYEIMDIHNLTHIWIGVSRQHSDTDEKPWNWEFERDPVNLPLKRTFWGPGEPNNFREHKERCVELRRLDKNTGISNWNDQICERKNPFLCEKLKVIENI